MNFTLFPEGAKMYLMTKKILIIAGTHGVEPQSTYFAKKIAELHCANSETGLPFDLHRPNNGSGITVLPNLNQWGLERNSRTNENGVDLNRNMPSKNWAPEFKQPAYHPGSAPGSETETQALVKIIEEGDYDLILTLHTTHFMHIVTPPQVNLDETGDGIGMKAAKQLSEDMKLPLTEEFAYTCKGSLGSYCKDKKIACITVEFEDELSNEETWEKYSQAFKNCFESLNT